MSVDSSDIEFRLTGGAGNSNPNASIGGAMSSTSVVDNVDNNLFDDVTPAEAASGESEYRALVIRNAHAANTLIDARIFVPTNTPSSATTIEIGIAADAYNSDPTAVANEDTAPTSVTFSAPSSYATGLQLNGSTGLGASGGKRGVWIKRVINAATGAITGDTATIRVDGQTT